MTLDRFEGRGDDADGSGDEEEQKRFEAEELLLVSTISFAIDFCFALIDPRRKKNRLAWWFPIDIERRDR